MSDASKGLDIRLPGKKKAISSLKWPFPLLLF